MVILFEEGSSPNGSSPVYTPHETVSVGFYRYSGAPGPTAWHQIVAYEYSNYESSVYGSSLGHSDRYYYTEIYTLITKPDDSEDFYQT